MNEEVFIKAKNELNKKQLEAVESIYGPVMVIAGPGTGKTQILALRIANLLKETDTDASNILCLTFTEAGTTAMRERLKKFIGTEAYKVTINTFHGFANNVIQDYPENFSFSRDLIQLDDVSRLKIVRDCIDTAENLDYLKPFYNKYAKEKDIISAIQTLKKEGLNYEELRERVSKLIDEHNNNPKLNRKGQPTVEWKKRLEKLKHIYELATVYGLYQSKLTEEGFYDYEDMILFLGDELKENEEFRAQFHEKYQFILVDEYQDTNGGQNEILKWLCSYDESPNLFVVGDDDQAIYRFQGANLENILSFNTTYKNVKTIAINLNYRSTQKILDIASSTIKNNEQRLTRMIETLDKDLVAHFKDNDEQIDFHEFDKKEDEYIFIANKIQNLINNGVDPSEIAVIYRKNAHGYDINDVLAKYDIKTDHKSSDNILNNSTVNNFIKLLRVINLYNKNIDEDLYRVMLFPFFKIPVVDLYNLVLENRKEEISFVEKVLNVEQEEDKIYEFSNMLQKWHRDSSNINISNLILNIINDIKLFNFIPEAESFDDVVSLISFIEFVKSSEKINRNISLSEILNNIDLIIENNYSINKVNSENTNGVNLLTAHSSKGLEFEYVFIIHLTQNNWGNTRKPTDLLVPEIYNNYYDVDDEKKLRLEDERRLFFVAITRAKNKVIFTKSNLETAEDNKKQATSQFIDEIGKENINFFGPEDHKTEIEDLEKLLSVPSTEPYSKQEEEFLKKRIEAFSLSPTALNDYLESPILFKERYLIRIPTAKNKHIAMGTGIHASLEFLNKKLIEIKDVSKVELEELENIYKAVLKKEFEGDEDYLETMEEGLQILRKYYDYYVKSNIYELPIEAEYNFGFHNVILPLENGGDIRLTGKIDKVEMINEETNSVRIVDFKTAKQKSENQIKGKTKDSDGKYWRQLVFYKLLTELDSEFKPKNKFSSEKYNVKEVQLDFLREDKGKFTKRSFEITKQDVDKLKLLINEVMKNIRDLNFPDKPNIVIKGLD